MRINKNETIYTQLNHVSRSGMSRRIRCYVVRNNKILDISWLVAEKTGNSLNDKGILMSGCGMDMGFALVYNFSYCLWPKGYICNGDKCHSNDHANQFITREEGKAKKFKHSDGGYCLNHQWL